MPEIGRLMLFAGLALAALGGLLLLLGRFPHLPLGRLPGDVSWEVGNVRVYLPLATMLLVSILLTVVLNVIARFFK